MTLCESRANKLFMLPYIFAAINTQIRWSCIESNWRNRMFIGHF